MFLFLGHKWHNMCILTESMSPDVAILAQNEPFSMSETYSSLQSTSANSASPLHCFMHGLLNFVPGLLWVITFVSTWSCVLLAMALYPSRSACAMFHDVFAVSLNYKITFELKLFDVSCFESTHPTCTFHGCHKRCFVEGCGTSNFFISLQICTRNLWFVDSTLYCWFKLG